ncbi:MAG TPA: acyl-CoA dehydrogenase family protein [Marinobacter sp.]|nr:acyl-CoA dehydrogenase family protein [Marinobacter sp.]
MCASSVLVEDLQPLMDEVCRFSSSKIAAVTRRPELPATADAISELSQAAHELGILPGDDQEPGFALWAQPEDISAIAFTVDALKQIASVNAGIALAWHRNALARFLAGAIGVTLKKKQIKPLVLTVATAGHHGLARGALARWLAQKCDIEDESLLADWVDRRAQPTTIIAAPQWQDLIWLVWHEGALCWQLLNREQMTATLCRPQHGLDELSAWQVTANSGAGTVVKANRQQVSSLLILDALGLLAIAAGINQHGEALAQAYAAMRRQGGQIINRHPAVQTMLANIRQAQWEADLTLNGLTKPLSELTPEGLLMARQQLHPRLCQAANLVMQVHGGVGYMQDCGPEKLLRDQNMLRLQSGGIREIPLFIHVCAGV